MIISLCGDAFDTQKVITKLKDEYGDKIIVINYFQEAFNTRIDNESIKQQLSRDYFYEYTYNIVNKKIQQLIQDNQDKIIILVSNNILEYDVDKTPFFNISNLKILITSTNKDKQQDLFYSHHNLYNLNQFDHIIDINDKINIRKLVHL